MKNDVFYWVLNMSIVASVFGILLCFLRFIKGFPKFASYSLWSVVIIRLLCPIGITSQYSLLNIISKITEKAYVKTVPVLEGLEVAQHLPELSISNAIQGAASYQPITYKTSLLEGFFEVASVIWMIVFLAAVMTITTLYFLAKSEIKSAILLRDNIYVGEMVNTPTVYGIIKPKIILPIGVTKEELKYIVAHEKVHIKRHDNIWRIVAILAACVHWFNPLSWLFLKSFFNDCELACDQAVVKGMVEEERKTYARTLLTYTTVDKIVFASAFGNSKVKLRIKNILSYKKLTLFSSLCFAGMVLVIAFLLLTNAV